ncbi:FecCD family ABC transporter permease [Pirellulaceae bacterium SH449]
MFASTLIGAVTLPFDQLVRFLLGQDSTLSEQQQFIFWNLRLPRVLNAAVVGGALGAAGVGFQGLFRNVLADPYIIGASSGAALGVALTIAAGASWGAFGLSSTAVGAMLGSLLVVSLVFVIGSLASNMSSLTLLLAGVAISSFCSSMVSLLLFLKYQKAVAVLSWLMGSMADSDWYSLRMSLGLAIIGIVMLALSTRALDAFLLGDVSAQSLGLNLYVFRALIVVGASLATAAAVSTAGIIGFVGLIAPQIGRLLVGPRHGSLLFCSILIGGTLMVVADMIARTVLAPTELPVGILTAMLGCPFFLFLILKRKGGRGMPPEEVQS